MASLSQIVKAITVLSVLAGPAACSRPMTDAESAFANDLFGSELDTSPVRVAQGLGITPLYKTVPTSFVVVQGTEDACVRTPQPRGAQPAPAFAYKNRIHFQSGLYSSDMALAWPRALRVPHALILAHELTHVWQWQNRAVTSYSPARALAESLRFADPYYSSPGTAAFFSFGYEQQAAIVTDYVCFTLSNPTHPRRAELRAILEPVLPVDAFEEAIGG